MLLFILLIQTLMSSQKWLNFYRSRVMSPSWRINQKNFQNYNSLDKLDLAYIKDTMSRKKLYLAQIVLHVGLVTDIEFYLISNSSLSL